MRTRYAVVATLGLVLAQMLAGGNVAARMAGPSGGHGRVAGAQGRAQGPGVRREALPAIKPPPRVWPNYAGYIAAPGSHPLTATAPTWVKPLYGIKAETLAADGPYVTDITIDGMYDVRKLQALNVPILAAYKDTATVVVHKLQLERLALHNMLPHHTQLLTQLRTRAGAALTTQTASPTASQILAAQTASTTSSSSGSPVLTDQERQWWCLTDPGTATTDSNNNGISDDDEVQAILDWLHHARTTRLTVGPPFSGWPSSHPGCTDNDQDGVPDAVEIFVVGTNPNLPSTARDRYTDSQKLFGVGPPCPSTGCADGLAYP